MSTSKNTGGTREGTVEGLGFTHRATWLWSISFVAHTKTISWNRRITFGSIYCAHTHTHTFVVISLGVFFFSIVVPLGDVWCCWSIANQCLWQRDFYQSCPDIIGTTVLAHPPKNGGKFKFASQNLTTKLTTNLTLPSFLIDTLKKYI